ncbi:MAG: hypothetical protein Q8P07_02970 [bacterium]|nr:hypothetical protein [bacterium]
MKKILLPFIDKSFSFSPKKPFQILCERRGTRRELTSSNLHFPIGDGDVPKLEPKRLNFRSVDKIVRDLRRIYKENPALFDIPTFAQKIY